MFFQVTRQCPVMDRIAMNLNDRQYYKYHLKHLRRKDGKKGKPPTQEILEAEKEMIKFREFMDMGIFAGNQKKGREQDAGY